MGRADKMTLPQQSNRQDIANPEKTYVASWSYRSKQIKTAPSFGICRICFKFRRHQLQGIVGLHWSLENTSTLKDLLDPSRVHRTRCFWRPNIWHSCFSSAKLVFWTVAKIQTKLIKHGGVLPRNRWIWCIYPNRSCFILTVPWEAWVKIEAAVVTSRSHRGIIDHAPHLSCGEAYPSSDQGWPGMPYRIKKFKRYEWQSNVLEWDIYIHKHI